MKVRWFAIPLSLLAATQLAQSQDLLGAAKALERYRVETARAKDAGKPKDSAVVDFRAKLEELRRSQATLSPEDAAERWLALVGQWRALTVKQRDLSEEDSELGSFRILIGALPGPAAWDAISQKLAAQTPSKDDENLHTMLQLFVAILRKDAVQGKSALDALEKAIGKGSSASYYRHISGQFTTWLSSLTETAEARVDNFDKALAEFEQSRTSSDFTVPDLVTLVGEKRAEEYLRRILSAPYLDFSIPVGTETRRLARRTALTMIDQIKRSPWQIIDGISSDDAALFEALSKKFPETDSDPDEYRRKEATQIYFLNLVAQKRAKEAAALAESLVAGESNSYDSLISRHADLLTKAGLGAGLRDFLKELLQQKPALPYWDDFIKVSAHTSSSGATLDFMREMESRPGLDPAARDEIRRQLWSALLAADEVETGGKLLLESVENQLGEVDALLQSGSSKASAKISGTLNDAVKLATLGQLLKNEAWQETGVRAAKTIWSKTKKPSANLSIRSAEKVADLLSKLGRPAEAESILIEDWVISVQPTEKRGYLPSVGQTGPYALLNLYHKANRSADVLKLLNESPDWGAKDLISLISTYSGKSNKVGVSAAQALGNSSRAEEALRVLAAALQYDGSDDEAFALLLKLDPAQAEAKLDALATRDRFEERPLIWKAKLQLDAGKIDEAEKTARAAIAIDPSDGEQGKGNRLRAYAVLGDILEKKGDAAQAKVMRGAVQAIRLSEDADDWWHAGLLTRAIKMYEQSLTHFADAYCIQSRLALRYSELGDFEKAEAHYRRAYELMPDSFGRIESHCFGCEGAFKGERAQGIAEKVFTRLAQESPTKPQVHYLMGYLREQQGRYAEALAHFQKAVALDPEYLNAWKKLLGLSSKIELPPAARQAAALNLLRLDPLRRHGAGTSEISQLNDFRAAWVIFEQAAKLQPKNDPVFPLPASAAALEQNAREPQMPGMHRRFYTSQPNTFESPAEILSSLPTIRTISEIMDLLSYFN